LWTKALLQLRISGSGFQEFRNSGIQDQDQDHDQDQDQDHDIRISGFQDFRIRITISGFRFQDLRKSENTPTVHMI
jgi:hypothetical protein